ncbi:hypothetical protein Ddc_17363 [Ditylenchus destructor]|nr:hypothetical protein Ddc_17363 [Ditylenchus destructor]
MVRKRVRSPLAADIPSSVISKKRFDYDRELRCNDRCTSVGTVHQSFSSLNQSGSQPLAHQYPIPLFDSPAELETPLNSIYGSNVDEIIPTVGEENQMNIHNTPILSIVNTAPIDIDHCRISRLFHRPCTKADQEWFCPAFVEKWSREFGNQSLIIRLNDQYIEVGPSHQKIIRDWLHRCAKIVFARHVVAPKNRNFCSLLLEYDARPIAVFTYTLSEKKDTGDLTIHFHLLVIKPDHVERNLMEYLLKELLPRYHPKCTMYEIVCVKQVDLWFTTVFAPVFKHIVQDQTVVKEGEYITSPLLDCIGYKKFKCHLI